MHPANWRLEKAARSSETRQEEKGSSRLLCTSFYFVYFCIVLSESGLGIFRGPPRAGRLLHHFATINKLLLVHHYNPLKLCSVGAEKWKISSPFLRLPLSPRATKFASCQQTIEPASMHVCTPGGKYFIITQSRDLIKPRHHLDGG